MYVPATVQERSRAGLAFPEKLIQLTSQDKPQEIGIGKLSAPSLPDNNGVE
jgi:hypothetical protein